MTDVSFAPVVSYATQIITPVIGAVVAAVGAVVVYEIKKLTGIAISKALSASVEKAISDGVGGLIAKAEDNLAKKSITVASPEVAVVATKVENMLPGAAAKLGWTPSTIDAKIVGEIGRLQSNMTTVSVAPKP